MVLTRLSHTGELCPLSEHSYSDAMLGPSSSAGKRFSNAVCNKEVDSNSQKIHLLTLPPEILEKILSSLSYKQVGDLRRVCKKFEQVCSHILNSTFQKLQNQMLLRFQALKAQMPRRESSRRKHPLAREVDIVETLSMRLSLLQMSFGKHIEKKHCCFFAGEILDEVYKILQNMKHVPSNSKQCLAIAKLSASKSTLLYKVTDEFFDLSTMAMEYFKDHIEPCLPEISFIRPGDYVELNTRFSDGNKRRMSTAYPISETEDDIVERDTLYPSHLMMRKRIRGIRRGMKKYNSQLTDMKRELKGCKSKIGEQQKTILENVSRMDDCDKKYEESVNKLNEIMEELSKCREELQYWRSKAGFVPALCLNCRNTMVGSECAPHLRPDSCAVMDSRSCVIDANGSMLANIRDKKRYLVSVPKINSSSSNQESQQKELLGPSESSKRLDSDFLGFESVSDDDGDVPVDSVGRRVRERKRIKYDAA